MPPLDRCPSSSSSSSRSRGRVSSRPFGLLRSLALRNGLSIVTLAIVVITIRIVHVGFWHGPSGSDGNRGSRAIDQPGDPAGRILSECRENLRNCESAARDAMKSAADAKNAARELGDKIVSGNRKEGIGCGDKAKEAGGDAKILSPCPPCPNCPSCPSNSSPSSPSTVAGGSAGTSGGRRRWLTVGIPTVPRGENHLGETIESWVRQLPDKPGDPMYGNVVIVVMNMHGEERGLLFIIIYIYIYYYYYFFFLSLGPLLRQLEGGY